MKYIILIIFLCSFARGDYGTWIDTDKDCQNTRQEILITDGVNVRVDKKGCKVVSGLWFDNYNGDYITDPKLLDIDHIVPLSNANENGAKKWSKEKKAAFANDFDNLIAVSASANRSKKDKDPSRWLPMNQSYHCEYVRKWVKIKNKWGLSINKTEMATIEAILNKCE